MSDETAKPAQEEKPEYVPEPRGAARIPGIHIDAVDRRLRECTEYFQKLCDETDYRNLDWYLWRMQLRYAAGDDIFEVVDDAFMAARCLHDKHTMHLELKPPEMFMTRRIVPVELGIVSGMPMLMVEFAATYGMPLMMCIGKTAPENIMEEANLMTSFFRRGFCADYVELTGLAAVIYAGVLAAIGRGFEDEAALGINTYATARDSLRGMPPKALLPKLKRYDALNTALACILQGQFDSIGEILAPAAEAFAEEQERRLGDRWLEPDKMPVPKYFDLSILTILALAALREHAIELPTTGAIAGYRAFIRGLTEMPERRIEIPGLDEETRRILEEAGVDPDQIGVDNSFQHEKEASEERAAKLFEERQRRAQEAVRAKIAQGVAEEESHTSVESQKLGGEKLKMHDGEDGDEPEENGGEKRSYANFFDNDDEVDAAARKANEDAPEETSRESKDYGSFFDNDDGADRRVNDQDGDGEPREGKDFSGFFASVSKEDESLRANVEEENAPHEENDKSKDFSSFFANDDNEDDSSIRAHVEEEAAPAEDTGKSYSSFFDNLDENAIPKFDDGSNDDDAPKARTYSADFFSADAPVSSDLKMTLDEEPEPEPVAEPAPAPAPVVSSEPEIEDNAPRRDFTKLFDESAPTEIPGLRMQLTEEEKAEAAPKPEPPKPAPVVSSEPDPELLEGREPARDFSKFFDETDQRREEIDANRIEQEQAEATETRDYGAFFAEADDRRDAMDAAQAEQIDQSHLADDNASGGTRDFGSFFDDDTREAEHGDDDPEAQLRELEAEQARKAAEKAEAHKLKLELDGTEEPEIKKAESYQERMARIIAEKQQAAREQAMREREEALRELEELQKSGVNKPVVEELRLKPVESDDPDEKVVKTGPEDLVIQGFAYTDLDRIHENTRLKDDLEEDFDMHAAMAQKQFEEMQEKERQKREEAMKTDAKADAQDDDDLHVVIDYSTLSQATPDNSPDSGE